MAKAIFTFNSSGRSKKCPIQRKLDKADTIEGYAEKFEAILEAASDESGDAPATPKSTPLP